MDWQNLLYALYTHHKVMIRLIFTMVLQKDKLSPGHLCQIWYSLLAPISRYWAKLRQDFWTSVNPLLKEIVITPESVMILT